MAKVLSKSDNQKWIATNEWVTREEMENMYRESGDDPDDYDIQDYQEIEIAVVRKGNEHGLKSGGWGGKDKIILFDGSELDFEPDKEFIDWCMKVAETVCKALNENNL